MAYTPELSQKYSGILRRIAWAHGIPMTKTIEGIVDFVGQFLDRKRVCDACRDKGFCEECPFNEKP